MKKRTGATMLVMGILCILGGVSAIVVGVMGFVDDLKPVVVVEAPGGTEFNVDEPGVYTLWHDHVTNHGGTFHNHDERLPPGFTFTLSHLDTGATAPFKALGASSTQTMNSGQRQSFGLGSFQVTDVGAYRLEASNPDRDQRIVSLTQGTFLSSFGSFGLSFMIAALAGVLGIALLIAGLVGLLAGRHPRSAGTPAPPPAR